MGTHNSRDTKRRTKAKVRRKKRLERKQKRQEEITEIVSGKVGIAKSAKQKNAAGILDYFDPSLWNAVNDLEKKLKDS